MNERDLDFLDSAPPLVADDEASDESAPNRRAFLRSGAAIAALAGAALVLPSLPAKALSLRFGDSHLLAFLEELEGFQCDFFTRAAQSSTADGLAEREMNLLSLIAQQDGQQTRWCSRASSRYGGYVYAKPGQNQVSSKLKKTYPIRTEYFSTRAKLMAAAIEVKSVAASAWCQAAAEADKGEIVAAFASLAGVQNRHIAALLDANGTDPFVAMVSLESLRSATHRLQKYGFYSEVLTLS